jgi:ketosteroid isomerase-like protein
VERLRRAYDAFSRGDFDTALEIVHPEFEFDRSSRRAAAEGLPLGGDLVSWTSRCRLRRDADHA